MMFRESYLPEDCSLLKSSTDKMEVILNKVTVLLAGWCPPTVVDERQSDEAINSALELIARLHPEAEVTFVSGLTDVGIMVRGYRKARELGWTLVGVSSGKAVSGKYGLFPVDSKIVVGMNWGDESTRFVEFITMDRPCYFVNVAGGKQAGAEEEMARHLGASILSFKLERN